MPVLIMGQWKWSKLSCEICIIHVVWITDGKKNVSFPVGNCMFRINNRNTRTRCEICSKLTIKTPAWHECRLSGVFIVDFEHISLCSRVSIVNFEQVNAGCRKLFELNENHTFCNIKKCQLSFGGGVDRCQYWFS